MVPPDSVIRQSLNPSGSNPEAAGIGADAIGSKVDPLNRTISAVLVLSTTWTITKSLGSSLYTITPAPPSSLTRSVRSRSVITASPIDTEYIAGSTKGPCTAVTVAAPSGVRANAMKSALNNAKAEVEPSKSSSSNGGGSVVVVVVVVVVAAVVAGAWVVVAGRVVVVEAGVVVTAIVDVAAAFGSSEEKMPPANRATSTPASPPPPMA